MRVSVFDRSGGGKVLLSTVEVDLVSFAAGQTLLEVSCPLVPASADVEPKLLPGASATVTVALVSPASLVSPEDIEGGAVVTVTIEGVSTPPPVFAVVRPSSGTRFLLLRRHRHAARARWSSYCSLVHRARCSTAEQPARSQPPPPSALPP